MKQCKKTIALLLSIVMTLSLFSVVGFADGEQFTVTFYKSTQSTSELVILETQQVNPGGSATDHTAGKTEEQLKEMLSYPADATTGYKWVFKGWSKELTNVQSDLAVFPVFEEEAKKYKVTYHDWEGNPVTDGVVECTWGKPVNMLPAAERPKDATYSYSFYAWSLKQNADPTNPDDEKYKVDWSIHFSLPTDEMLGQHPEDPDYINLDGKEPIPVNVYPCFSRTYNDCYASIRVVDQFNEPLEGATVTMLDANKNAMHQTFAAKDENGNPTNEYEMAIGTTDSNGKVVFSLPYQAKYFVDVSYNKDSQNLMVRKETSKSELEKEQGLTIQLQKASLITEGGKDRCTCVCHTFLGGVWVHVLNLMHYLLKVNYVCCPDMFETHGKDLSYGPK